MTIPVPQASSSNGPPISKIVKTKHENFEIKKSSNTLKKTYSK